MNPHGTPENLRPWRKGQSGNPGGRRRTPPFTKALEKVIGMKVKDIGIKPSDKIPLAIVKTMVSQALNGDMRTAVDIANRVDGPVRLAQAVGYENPYDAEPDDALQMDMAIQIARVMVERSLAFKLPLPEVAQEAVRRMDAETVAEAERAGIIEPSKTFGTPPEGEEPQRGPVGGADAKAGEEK